jgi:hypothetical protein
MTKLVATLAVLVVFAGGCAVAAEPRCLGDGLSREQLLQIAASEALRKRGMFDASEWRFSVSESKCDYMVFADGLRPGPGRHFSVRIKRNGTVDYYMGGA